MTQHLFPSPERQLLHKSVSLFQYLICQAHCDALSQSLDGPAGRNLKKRFCGFFPEGQPESILWLVTLPANQSRRPQILRNLWWCRRCRRRFTLSFHKEVRPLWKTPCPSKTRLRAHKHRRLLSERLDGLPPARPRRTQARCSDAKQGLFEMLMVGRKGRESRRGSSSLSSAFCVVFRFVPLNWALLRRPSQLWVMMRSSGGNSIHQLNAVFIITSSVVLLIWIITSFLDLPWSPLFCLSSSVILCSASTVTFIIAQNCNYTHPLWRMPHTVQLKEGDF